MQMVMRSGEKDILILLSGTKLSFVIILSEGAYASKNYLKLQSPSGVRPEQQRSYQM